MLPNLRERTPILKRSFYPSLDHFFGDFFRDFEDRTMAIPPVNLLETAEAMVIEAEVPGYTLDQIKVSVHGDRVEIEGEATTERNEGVKYHRQERRTESFRRVFQLPAEVDAERVSARLKEGVLTVELPKAAAVLPRQIPIKTK